MKPLVSIIVPIYNCGKYINKCLDSILVQSYNNWEAIVVNDGSTDNSLEIIRRYELLDYRIKVIDQLNTGVVTARSNALQVAKGEYLTFLDGDDRLTPEALSLMIEAMERDSADICVGNYSLEWEQNGKRVSINHRKKFFTSHSCFRYCMTHGEMFLAIKIFRTNLFKKVVSIPQDVIIQEDAIGLTQYLSYANRATYINQTIYIYLKRPEGASSRMSQRHIKSLIKVAEFLLHNKFAMSMPHTVHKYCAAIAIRCLSSSEISLPDKQRVQMILESLSKLSIVSVRLDNVKGKIKSIIKKLIR